MPAYYAWSKVGQGLRRSRGDPADRRSTRDSDVELMLRRRSPFSKSSLAVPRNARLAFEELTARIICEKFDKILSLTPTLVP